VERRAAVLLETAAVAGERLQRLVKSSIGVTVDVHVVDPDTVERSVGKMRRVVDRRPRR
jgi:phenylacetate-CoA ligase